MIGILLSSPRPAGPTCGPWIIHHVEAVNGKAVNIGPRLAESDRGLINAAHKLAITARWARQAG
jgi:hypothetical protein